jgi:hypothetical protein
MKEVTFSEQELYWLSLGRKTLTKQLLDPEPPEAFMTGDVAAITDGERWALSISYLDPRGSSSWPADPEPGFLCPFGEEGDHLKVAGTDIVLEITNYRLERLQHVTLKEVCDMGMAASIYDFLPVDQGFSAFAKFWDDQHGPGAWDANPWVWNIEFEVVSW